MRRMLLLLLLLAPGMAWAQAGGLATGSPIFVGGSIGNPLLLPDGSDALPSIATTNDPDTGWRWAATGEWRYVANATPRFALTNGGVFQIRSNGQLAFSSGAVGAASDTFVLRDAAATFQLGLDSGTAPIAQTLKGADGNATGIGGGNLTLRAGAGTVGDAAGGRLILGGGAASGAGERGVVAFEDGGTKPTCAAANRGAVWYDAGAAGVADTFEVCRKDAANNYAWVTLF